MRRSARLAVVAAVAALTVSACGEEAAVTTAPAEQVDTEQSDTEEADTEETNTEAADTDPDPDAPEDGTDDTPEGERSETDATDGAPDGIETTDSTEDVPDGPVGDAPPLEDLWPEAMAVAQAAEAVDMSFTGTVDGMSLDLRLTGQVDDSNFSITGRVDDIPFDLIYDGEAAYIKAGAGFWEMAGAPDGSEMADTWLIAPDQMDVESSFSVSSLWGDFMTAIPTTVEASDSEETDLDGTPAYRYSLAYEDGDIWIDAVDQTVLRVDVVEGAEDLVIDFLGWNGEVETFAAPEGAIPFEEFVENNS